MGTRISEITGGASSVQSDKIEVNEINHDLVEVYLKPEGFSSKMAGNIFFALFWNGFLVVWTTLALQDSLAFAAFSIPFWIVGLVLIVGVIVAFFGNQKIIIEKNRFILQKNVLFRRAHQIIPYNTLLSIENLRQLGAKKTAKLAASSSQDNGLLSNTPTITYTIDGKRKELMFAEHLDKNDREWLVNYLNEQIATKMRFIH